MTDELKRLKPRIVAALKSPPGTTLEDLAGLFPELDREERFEEEFRNRYNDAIFDWQHSNGWKQAPYEVAQEIAEQIRHEMEYQIRSGRLS
ncbi:hypothetical protein [Gordonia metallireducens]|uniref:hypothetical protein n=1 Tax=Gordonia metallireducens TaxID=2897779 RepID=UPI001E3115F8|nr:hypothetical protein [Gordonia metallireducens]